MKRSCTPYIVKEFLKEHPYYKNVDIKFYIDNNNYEEIAIVLLENRNRKKLDMILNAIFSGNYLDEVYGNENVGKNVSIKAMKFKNLNERIYCKEINAGGKKIVMLMAYYKKSQKITKKLKNKIEIINEYEYEFED